MKPTITSTMRGHTDMVRAAAFYHDGERIVTGSNDKTLRIWDIRKAILVEEPFEGHQSSVLSVAISPDDTRIASGGADTTVIIWNIKSKQRVLDPLVKHTDWVLSVCFSPDGKKLASGSGDCTVVVWDAETGTVLETLHHFDSVWTVAFSPDGLKLASGSMCTVWVWNTHTNAELLLKIDAHQFSVQSIVWSPDGQKIVSASEDKTVRFWNSWNGCQIGQPCTGHTDSIGSLAISSDGSFIATASLDNTVRLWSTKTHQQIALELQHTAWALCVAISSNGALLASGAYDGKVFLWPIGSILEKHKVQERLKEERDHGDPMQIIVETSGLLPELNVHTIAEGPTSFLANSFSNTTEIPPETKEARDPRRPEHKESNEDVDPLDKQQGCNDLQPSFVPDPSESISAATLQDLTEFITKTGDYPVARGGFGEIWKCTYRTDRGPIAVAVKSLLVYASDQLGGAMEKKTKRIHHEIRTCARLKHHNILSVYGYIYGFGLFMAIVSPWAENGNLTTYLEQEDAHLTMVRRFQILRDITDGLHYLHMNNVIHGDLTGPNVLIHGDGTACLADFGLSLVYSEVMSISLASWTSTFHGNFRWLAPELLGEPDNEPDNELPVRPSKCSDVYSFGGIMLQVLTSRPPYYYLSEAAVIQRISSGVKPLRSRYPALSDKYWHLIEECWSAAPQDRPLAEGVVRVIGDEQDLLARS